LNNFFNGFKTKGSGKHSDLTEAREVGNGRSLFIKAYRLHIHLYLAIMQMPVFQVVTDRIA
jgi:hypothetical protein